MRAGSGKIKHREFAMASGEMNREAFTEFLESAFKRLVEHSLDGSIHYICMDWRHLPEILAAGEAVYDELKNLVVWAKDNGGMGTFYRSRHELIFAFKHGTAPHLNTFELGQHGRYRTNVWQYRGVNTLRPGRMEELALHPTVKPVQLIADAIRDVSGPGRDRARCVRRLWLDPDRGGEDWPEGPGCANSTPSIATASSPAGETYAKDDAERLACTQPDGARCLEPLQ